MYATIIHFFWQINWVIFISTRSCSLHYRIILIMKWKPLSWKQSTRICFSCIDFSWLFMDAVWRNVDGIFLGPFLGISRVFGFEIGSTESRWKTQIVCSKSPWTPTKSNHKSPVNNLINIDHIYPTSDGSLETLLLILFSIIYSIPLWCFSCSCKIASFFRTFIIIRNRNEFNLKFYFVM